MDKIDKIQMKKKPGRKRTKRQAQIHPKVRPEIAEEFGYHATENDMSHGQFFEKIWVFYKKNYLKMDS